MASRFGMEPVLKRCEEVIATQSNAFNPSRLFQLTQTLSQHQRNSLAMSVMMDKLARMDSHELSQMPFSDIPGDVVADLYAVKVSPSAHLSRILSSTNFRSAKPRRRDARRAAC